MEKESPEAMVEWVSGTERSTKSPLHEIRPSKWRHRLWSICDCSAPRDHFLFACPFLFTACYAHVAPHYRLPTVLFGRAEELHPLVHCWGSEPRDRSVMEQRKRWIQVACVFVRQFERSEMVMMLQSVDHKAFTKEALKIQWHSFNAAECILLLYMEQF